MCLTDGFSRYVLIKARRNAYPATIIMFHSYFVYIFILLTTLETICLRLYSVNILCRNVVFVVVAVRGSSWTV